MMDMMLTKVKILMMVALSGLAVDTTVAMDEKEKIENTKKAIEKKESRKVLESRLQWAQLDLQLGVKLYDKEKISSAKKRIQLLEEALKEQSPITNIEKTSKKENQEISKEIEVKEEKPIKIHESEKNVQENKEDKPQKIMSERSIPDNKEVLLNTEEEKEYSIKGNKFVVNENILVETKHTVPTITEKRQNKSITSKMTKSPFFMVRSRFDREDVDPLDVDQKVIRSKSGQGSLKCFHFAREKLNLKDLPYFETQEVKLAKELQNEFTSVTTPEEGDLVVYYLDEETNTGFKHFGVALKGNLVESQWGADRVFIHPLFYVPNSYGKVAMYYRPKPNGKYAQCVRSSHKN